MVSIAYLLSEQPPAPNINLLDSDQFTRLAATTFAAIGLYIAIGNLSSRLAPEKHPRIVASVLCLVVIVLQVIFTQMIVGLWYVDVVALILGVLMTFIVLWSLTRTDKEAIEIAEDISGVMRAIDSQLTFILGEIVSGGSVRDVDTAIRYAIQYVIWRMTESLAIGNPYDMRISVLTPNNGRFKVLERWNIKVQHISLIEKKLSYGKSVRGIAGLVANKLEPVCINDLSDTKNKDTEHWVRIESEEQAGSIICYPIIKGRGLGKSDGERELLGIFNISCSMKDAFRCESVSKLLDHYSDKLEMLIEYLALNQNRTV